jgi:RNA polymerase sigma-70 factor (ECF subfamily)
LTSHWPALFRQAMRLMGNASDAKDLVQDTFERAVRALPQFQPGSNMRAWLYTIMVRRARDHFRRDRAHPLESVDEESLAAPEADAAASPWSAITEEQFRAAIEQLESPFREVFELHEVHRMHYQDIALQLRVPMNTVASRLRRAREKLRRLLVAQMEDGPAAEAAH